MGRQGSIPRTIRSNREFRLMERGGGGGRMELPVVLVSSIETLRALSAAFFRYSTILD